MKGLTQRPNLTGSVPFAINAASIQRVIDSHRRRDPQGWNVLSGAMRNRHALRTAALQTQTNYVAFVLAGIQAMDPNFGVSPLGITNIEQYFLRTYPIMNQIINPPAPQAVRPNMEETFTRGTAAYRRVRAEIATALGIRDAGHNVGHGSNSTVADNRGQIIENLMARVIAGPERNRIFAESQRIYGHTPTR